MLEHVLFMFRRRTLGGAQSCVDGDVWQPRFQGLNYGCGVGSSKLYGNLQWFVDLSLIPFGHPY